MIRIKVGETMLQPAAFGHADREPIDPSFYSSMGKPYVHSIALHNPLAGTVMLSLM